MRFAQFNHVYVCVYVRVSNHNDSMLLKPPNQKCHGGRHGRAMAYGMMKLSGT